MSQQLLSELFQKDVRTISDHVANIFEKGELDPEATIQGFRRVQTEGNREVPRLFDFRSGRQRRWRRARMPRVLCCREQGYTQAVRTSDVQEGPELQEAGAPMGHLWLDGHLETHQ
jgi:hypothetical protein